MLSATRIKEMNQEKKSPSTRATQVSMFLVSLNNNQTSWGNFAGNTQGDQKNYGK